MSYAQREFFNKRLFLYPCKWFLYPCRGPALLIYNFCTLAEDTLYPCRGFKVKEAFPTPWRISVRSLQHNDGSVSDHIKNIYSWSGSPIFLIRITTIFLISITRYSWSGSLVFLIRITSVLPHKVYIYIQIRITSRVLGSLAELIYPITSRIDLASTSRVDLAY